ncbi:MAG: enoyl-CoA hydratase [Elusimicrobia bacterium RIFOXYD12_FULL_66_9]|nr:MAG: enoyl-CoA hydratase [Elusimicrobia bacterium RIFOXYD12_FULL_66_9]
MSTPPEVLIEKDGPVGIVTLFRPKTLNALAMPLMKALLEALEAFDADPAVRVMLVTGSDRAFAAGADINEMKDLADAKTAEAAMAEHLARWDRIAALHKPVIAAVSGYALGGGCELAMACDIIVASETAQFGQPEALIGVIPGAGGTQRLTKAVGKALAMDLCLTGRRLSAREALAAGLVSRVFAPESFLAEAKKLAHEVAKTSPLAARAAKRCVRAALDLETSVGLRAERKDFYLLFDTKDQKEGMKAFAEKRPPQFKGD